MSEENKEVLDQNVVQNGNPYDIIDNDNQKNQNVNGTNLDTQEPGKFLKKIIKSVAKMAWLPDPETGEPAKSTWNNAENNNQTNEAANIVSTTLDQDVVAQEEQKTQEEEKKTFSFDSIMSGVSGVLDKIGKKVEEKTWLNLDDPLKKREEESQQEAEKNKTEATPSTTETTNEPAPENEVEKNNEEYLSENH